MSEVTHFWTVSPYYHAGSKSVLPTHGSPMMSVWWPTSSSEGVTVCDDKQWRTKQILFTSLFLALFQNLMSYLSAYTGSCFLWQQTGTSAEWVLTLFSGIHTTSILHLFWSVWVTQLSDRFQYRLCVEITFS